MSEHEGAEVARLVLVGEVVLGDARLRVVVDGAQVFSVCRVLPLARQPHHVAHHRAPRHLLLLLHEVDQVLWRGLARRKFSLGTCSVGQLRPLLEGFRLPVKNLQTRWKLKETRKSQEYAEKEACKIAPLAPASHLFLGVASKTGKEGVV